jgi:hypothetical protein
MRPPAALLAVTAATHLHSIGDISMTTNSIRALRRLAFAFGLTVAIAAPSHAQSAGDSTRPVETHRGGGFPWGLLGLLGLAGLMKRDRNDTVRPTTTTTGTARPGDPNYRV